MRLWSINKNLLHTLRIPVLLVAVILAVYYPAMLSGIHPIDDPGIITFYSNSPSLSLVLLPGTGYYYRPLIELSFWIDNFLWGMEPVVMHMENILLHCANSFLVYLLARKVSEGNSDTFPLIPLIASLLFALHPVNVEAVAWIAGRTDPLLTLFVLSVCWFLLRWLADLQWQDMTAALVFFIVALLTKETALAFCGVIFLLVLAWPGAATFKQRTTAVCILMTPGLLLGMFALFFWNGTSGLNRFTTGSDLNCGQGGWNALIATGFYTKKLIFPIPLNFAITEVPPIYSMVGIVLVPTLYWAFRSNRRVGVLLISALLLTMPAVIVAVKQIAWTPFAERYLYLPAAFCAIGLSVFIQSYWKQFRLYIIFLMLIVLTGFVVISVQRAMLWGNKYDFIQDAVAKSPDFGSLYNELGGLFLLRGEADKAAESFATADRLNKRPSMRLLIKANMMRVQYIKGNYTSVRESFYQIFNEKKEASADFLELLYKADYKRLNTLSGDDKTFLAEDLLETLALLNQKRYDPFWLYISGKLSLVVGDKVRASDFFRNSYIAAPADAHYRKAAAIHFQKLENKQ